ncbi:MAG: hypothetical protein HYZ53_10735 [Planctomycetes bacterium]|nr:hypothetical protein [Planctomycetota bacterium]
MTNDAGGTGASSPGGGAAGATEGPKSGAPGEALLTLRFTRKERHDLFTPINQIIGYGELLLEDAQGAWPEDQVATLKKVLTASKNLNRLLGDLLARAQPEGASASGGAGAAEEKGGSDSAA